MTTEPEHRRPPWRWVRVRRPGGGYRPEIVIASFIGASLAVGNSIVVPVLPLYGMSLGASGFLVGLLVGGFALGRLFTDPLSGPVADRFGARRIAVGGCLVLALGATIAGLGTTFSIVLVGRVIQGIGAALYTTPAQTLVMSLAPEGQTGRAMSFFQGSLLIGFSAGPAVGGVLGSLLGLRAPFFALGAVGLIAAALTFRLFQEPPTASHTSATSLWEQLGHARQLMKSSSFSVPLLVAVTVFAVRNGIRNTLLPLFAAAAFGYSEDAIGVMLTVAIAANVLVLPHAGRALDERGRRPVLVVGVAATAAAVAVMATTPNGWVLFVLASVLGAVTAYPAVAPAVVVGDLATPGTGGTLVGVLRMAMDVGLMTGPMIAGALVDATGFRMSFVLLGVAVGVVALVVTKWMPETGQAGIGAGTDIPYQ